MTVPTAQAGIDASRVSAWLATALGLRPPLEFTRIGHGQSNLTYLVEDSAGAGVVLRRPPLGELARGAHDMAREHRILTALEHEPVPTPRPLAFTDDQRVTGATVHVMEYMQGRVLHTEEEARRLTVPARGRVGIDVARSLARLHDVDVDAVGLGDLGRRDAYAERQLRGWLRQWEATRTRALPSIDETAALLKRRIPPQRRAALVHGDYNLANAIVAETGQIRAILDWELSTLGDPIADLGTLLCYWVDDPADAILERDPVTVLNGFPSRAEVVDAYATASGSSDVENVPFWHALATWKLAVILEGVYRRRLANPANSRSSAEQLRAATDRVAEKAAALARQLS